MMWGMSPADEPTTPKTDDLLRDPDALKGAHQRSGQMFQKAGLPFEEEEFDDSLPRESDATPDGTSPAAEPTP